MYIILAGIFFLLGISVGSFLNVVADRIPRGKSILSPPSHCFECGHELEARDLIPVVSYILLKGRCRYCNAFIPVRSMLVELFTGLLFVIALLQLGLDWTLAEALMYISMFIVLVVTDLEIRVMPPNIVYPEIAIALLMAVINSFLMYQPGIISALVGLAFGMAFMAGLWVILRLSGKHSLSTGYFGMLGLIGVSTGFPLIIVALFVVVVIGGLSTLILMFFKKGKFYGNVPLALFFALGGTGAILWGKELLSVGANLMGR